MLSSLDICCMNMQLRLAPTACYTKVCTFDTLFDLELCRVKSSKTGIRQTVELLQKRVLFTALFIAPAPVASSHAAAEAGKHKSLQPFGEMWADQSMRFIK